PGRYQRYVGRAGKTGDRQPHKTGIDYGTEAAPSGPRRKGYRQPPGGAVNPDWYLVGGAHWKSGQYAGHRASASCATDNHRRGPNHPARLPTHPKWSRHFPASNGHWYRPTKTTAARE